MPRFKIRTFVIILILLGGVIMFNRDVSADGKTSESMSQNIVNSPGAQAYQTGRDMYVNQQRKILPEVKIEKKQDGDKFIMRLEFTQTEGIWDQGTDFKLQVKTTGPFEVCSIIKGLPPSQSNIRISENKQDGFYSYATSTAPIKNEPVVMEMISKNPIDVSQIGIEPLAS